MKKDLCADCGDPSFFIEKDPIGQRRVMNRQMVRRRFRVVYTGRKLVAL